MGSDTVCACGCEQPVTTRSHSPDFAGEHCQTAWNLRRLGHTVTRQQPPQVPQPRHAEDPWADVFLDRSDWPAGVDAIHTPSGILHRHP